jgi:hypothetical protein
VEASLYSISHTSPTSFAVDEHWKTVEEDGRFPLLCKLARATLSFLHGNAEVERLFSIMGDIVTKKRNRLQALSIRSLLLCSSYCSAYAHEPHTFPVSQGLIDNVKCAHQKYKEFQVEKRRQDEASALAAQEKVICRALQVEQENSKRLQRLEEEQRKVSL